MSSIWNTQKPSTENKSVWGSIRQEPQQQQVPPNASVLRLNLFISCAYLYYYTC